MLVLSRKAGERIRIGDDIVVTLVRIKPGGHAVHLGVDAPPHVRIDRAEIAEERDRGGQRDDG